LSTTFTGTIADGGNAGALTKVGRGRLTLGNASTYTGTTVVNNGQLLVTNTSGSATGTGMVQVNSGTLGGTGIIAGNVALGPATGRGAFLAPGRSRTNIGTLTIQSALSFDVASIFSCGFNTDTATADRVVANGVTINETASFVVVLTGNNPLPIGTAFTVIANSSATPISGTFSNLADGATVTINGNNFQADYQGGDGNDLTLTVIP
jgi:autotransporter-associated beta strand protein